MTQIQAILPIRAAGTWGTHDLARAKLLLRSLAIHWKGDAPLPINIVTPDRDLEEVYEGTKKITEQAGGKIRCSYQTDSTAFSMVGHKTPIGHGWKIQQLVKLIVATYPAPEHTYKLILDADVICIMDFSEIDLVTDYDPKAQAIYGRGKWIATDMHRGKIRRDWYEGSAQILGRDESLSLKDSAMGWTPQVLIPKVCNAVIARLYELHGSCWPHLLCSNRWIWSEFSLYALTYDKMAQKLDLMGDRHSPCWPLSMFTVEQSYERRPVEEIALTYGL